MDNPRLPRSATTPIARRAVASLAPPAAVTLLAIPEEHPPTPAVAVLYVLAVVIAARLGGAVSGIAASLLSFLALNFFFTPPFHTFVVAAPEDLVALFVFLVTSVIVGLLLSSALRAKSKSERRELEALLLNRLATRLLSGEPPEEVLSGFAEGLCDALEMSHCEISTTFAPLTDVARVDELGEPLRVPLSALGQDIGEMRIWAGGRGRLNFEEQATIESLATQLALALEGMRLSVEVRRAELEAHTSQLKAALFSGVTHDIKTPLGSIMAAVTSLIEGSEFSQDQRHQHLDTIRQETERLHRVVNNLLDVARLRAGALVANKVPSAIDEVMEGTLNRLRPLFGSRQVDLRVGDEVPEVAIDVVQIDQVLTNLIENAIKFTPPGSPVSLVAVGHAEGVRVTVFDQGPGIPKQDRARIFEPFERGQVDESGTGLGLAISKAIVVAHGGRMWVSDNPLGGAAFTFELPSGDAFRPQEVRSARESARR